MKASQLSLLLLCFRTISTVAQVDWASVPERLIGDSTATSTQIILTGTVRSASGEPVTGATLSLDVLKFFDYSDKQGRYTITCPTGKYRLIVRHVGMLPYLLRLDIRQSGVLDIIMDEGVVGLDEVVVSVRAKDANIKETIGGVTRLSIPELRTLPTLMGEVDILKSIQNLPGVTSTGEGSSAFNVRGGRNDQNLILLNGAPLFNASHALGFVSGFNQDALGSFTFYKGNVPAQFGGRAASVLDVKLRTSNADRWQYRIGAGLVSSRFTAEGPLVSGKTTLITGIRFSHANWFPGLVKDPDVRNSRVGFADGSAVLSHRFNPNSNVVLTLYGSEDNFRYASQFGFRWKNSVASVAWRALANRKASPLLTFSYGRYDNTLIDPSGFDASAISNRLNYLRLEETVQYSPGEKQTMTFGVESTAYLPAPEQKEPYGDYGTVMRRQVDRSHGVEGSVYVQDDITFGKGFSLSLGLRHSLYAHVGPDTVFRYVQGAPRVVEQISDTTTHKSFRFITRFGGLQPRISMRVAIGENQAIKAGYNRMYQFLHQVSNTTVPTPVDIWQVATAYLPPQRSDNLTLGYFRNFKENMFETSAEIFWKKMDNLVEYKDFAQLFQNTHLETDLLSGAGQSSGLELYANKRKGLWTGWISYTYSQTRLQVASDVPGESINDGKWYPAAYNRPHQFNLVVNRRMNHGSALSMVVAFQSGRPLTAVETSYMALGTVVPVYSERNQYRIGNYFRMDLSLTIGSILRKRNDNLVFSLYNLTGRQNPYSVFYKRIRTDYAIPSSFRLSVIGTAIPTLTYNLTLD